MDYYYKGVCVVACNRCGVDAEAEHVDTKTGLCDDCKNELEGL